MRTIQMLGLNMIEALEQEWQSNFADTPPVGYQFRNLFAERWVRFHSLPRSKRYAESESEYQTILSRHNQVLNEMAANERVFLITTEFVGDKEPSSPPRREMFKLLALDPNAEYWRTLPMHDIEEDPAYPNYWNLFASQWMWFPGIFDAFLRMVADDELGNLIIAGHDLSWLYLPYDGGADVILPSAPERDALREQHRDWLSDHPDGL